MTDYTPPRPISRWDVLTYIEEYKRSHHRRPRTADIARAFGVGWNVIHRHIRKLQSAGMVERNGCK